ncbi:MAG: glycosyltransferase family 9 protein, partial [Vicinamibacterales bacterium]|nr:glycosyltransferase family 9 protein [Vicinamibacterales bacterium]
MKILLVRLRLIGDVVFTTPAVRALRRRHPDSRLSYLVERAAAPVVATLPDLDHVLTVPHARGWRRLRDDLRLASHLRAARYDAVLDFHGGPRAAWLTWATGAPLRVGYTIAGRTWMYTRPVPRSRDLRPRHSVENQWDLLRAAFPEVGDPDPDRDPVVMGEDAAAAAAVARRWQAHALEGTAVVVVHVSAGNPFRRWPAEAIEHLVAGVAAGGANRRIILTSGPSEADAAARIGDAARRQLGPDATHRVVAFGDLTLPELRALVARAALYIGGDSGPLHVAATTGTPIVALFGPTLA